MALDDATELLATIQNRGTIPVNSGTWDNTALLKAASEEILTCHLPMLVAARGEYLVKKTDIPMVAAQEEYLLSYRAAAIRHLSILSQDNHELPLDQMEPPQQAAMLLDRTRQGTPRWFWFREGYFGVWPLPDSQASFFRVRWHIRPSRIVETLNCWQISSRVDSGGTTTLSFLTVCPTVLGGPSGTKYDFVGYQNPFSIKGFDVPSSSLTTGGASSSITFLTSNIPGDLLVGDWVCAFQQTAHPNVPQELHVAAALRAAAAATRSRDHTQAEKLEGQAVDHEKRLLNGILAPRSKGNIKRIVTTRWRRRI